jgi:hypothetical protein
MAPLSEPLHQTVRNPLNTSIGSRRHRQFWIDTYQDAQLQLPTLAKHSTHFAVARAAPRLDVARTIITAADPQGA